MQKDAIFKMKEWMFACTGDWNVFIFSDVQTVKAYKATLEAYDKEIVKPLVGFPPFTLNEVHDCQFDTKALEDIDKE